MEILALYIIRLKCKLVKYVYHSKIYHLISFIYFYYSIFEDIVFILWYLLIIILVNKYLLLFTK